MRALTIVAMALVIAAASANTFVQKTCVDAQCSNCTTQTFSTGTCISRNVHSYIVHCEANGLLLEEFDSTTCAGASRLQSQPSGVCAIVFGTFGQESFVEQYCTVTPPSPPQPPAPTVAPATPAPAGGTFTQETCADAACSQSCQQQTFPQNTCLNLSGGGTAIAVCTTSALALTVYSASSNCTGASSTTTQPINTCEQDNQGTFFENICSSNSTKALSTGTVKNSLKKHALRKSVV